MNLWDTIQGLMKPKQQIAQGSDTLRSLNESTSEGFNFQDPQPSFYPTAESARNSSLNGLISLLNRTKTNPQAVENWPISQNVDDRRVPTLNQYKEFVDAVSRPSVGSSGYIHSKMHNGFMRRYDEDPLTWEKDLYPQPEVSMEGELGSLRASMQNPTDPLADLIAEKYEVQPNVPLPRPRPNRR